VTAEVPLRHTQVDENSWANRPPSVDGTVAQHVKFSA